MINALPLTVLWLVCSFGDVDRESTWAISGEPSPLVCAMLIENSVKVEGVPYLNIDDGDLIQATSSARCYPNPFSPTNGQTLKFVVFLDVAGSVTIEVFDLFGNPVWERKNINGVMGENNGSDDPDLTWDGRDHGRPVAAGGYIARITAPDHTFYVKVAVRK